MAAVQIGSSGDLFFTEGRQSTQLLSKMSNSQQVALFGVGGQLRYTTSPDGVTWSTPAALPGTPGSANLCVAQVIADKLYLWYAGSVISLYVAPFTTGSNTFLTQTTHTYNPAPGATNYNGLDASWDGAAWHVACDFTTAGAHSIGLFKTPGADGTFATLQLWIDLHWAISSVNGLQVRYAASGFLYVAFYDVTRNSVVLFPVAITSSSYTFSTSNAEYPLASTDHSTYTTFVLELDGSLTFFVVQSSQLYTLKRSAANSYSAPQPLLLHDSNTLIPRTLLLGTDLYVAMETDVDVAHGGIFMVKRTAGSWALPVLFAGVPGGSLAVFYPILDADALLFITDDNRVFWQAWAPSSAPNAPLPVSPIGNVAGLTPTLLWTPQPSSPGDPMGGYEAIVYRVSDLHVMFDSGVVASGASSVAVPGGAALAYNVPYEWKVRQRDTLSSGGAGTFGPYSSLAVFTPRRGATVTITAVTSGGVTGGSSPVSVGALDLQAAVSYSQPDSDSTNAYRLVLYAADTTSILATTPWETLSPAIASGGSFTSLDWTPTDPVTGPILHNSTTYYLAVQTADAVNGVISTSAQWRLNVSWTPPAAVTGLAATVDDDAGTVTLNWTNPMAATSTLVEWRPYTESGIALPWRVISPAGVLWHQAIVFPSPMLRSDFRVTVYGTLGIPSAPVTLSNVVLGLAFDFCGIWYNDVADPLNIKLPLGYLAGWDSLKRTKMLDIQEFVPQGAQVATQTFGLRNDWQIGASASGKWFLPAQYLDSVGGVHEGADLRDMAIAMVDAHNVLIYRERRFPVPLFVKLMSYEEQPNDDVNIDLTLQANMTRYSGLLPVIGS